MYNDGDFGTNKPEWSINNYNILLFNKNYTNRKGYITGKDWTSLMI